MFKQLTTALTLGLAAAAIGVPTAAGAAPLSTWHGDYVWEENVGRHGGDRPGEGVVAFITHRLTLGAGAGPTGCRLNAEGYQTDRQMQCTATPRGNAVVIKFYKFGANAPGRYALGAPLFTMTRTSRGLVTRLQSLEASSDATPPVGRLFRRVG